MRRGLTASEFLVFPPRAYTSCLQGRWRAEDRVDNGTRGKACDWIDGQTFYDTLLMSFMSTSKLDTSGIFQPVTVKENITQLSLPAHAVKIRKNGIEFCADKPIPTWTEMTVDLLSSPGAKKVHCHGIIVACSGNRHSGYVVSMIFTNLTRQAQERLDFLAVAQV